MAGKKPSFNVVFTRSALDDLRSIRAFEQRFVMDQIEQQLTAQPLTESRNRKPLRPNGLSAWEMRRGRFRVFYDVAQLVGQFL